MAAEIGTDEPWASPRARELDTVSFHHWPPRWAAMSTSPRRCAIRRHAAGSTVVSDRITVRAQRVIVAVPPHLYSRIRFDPPLPRQHQLHQHLSMGLVIKVHAVYDTPFWRTDGLSALRMGRAAQAVLAASVSSGSFLP